MGVLHLEFSSPCHPGIRESWKVMSSLCIQPSSVQETGQSGSKGHQPSTVQTTTDTCVYQTKTLLSC
uniref:Uncharacterized protein n=1 Tax=Magallana gigas TaxID=29159 RepID=K1PLJ6_MAGGI